MKLKVLAAKYRQLKTQESFLLDEATSYCKRAQALHTEAAGLKKLLDAKLLGIIENIKPTAEPSPAPATPGLAAPIPSPERR